MDAFMLGQLDGINDGIVHVLSGIDELFVIARGTARSFAGRDVEGFAIVVEAVHRDHHGARRDSG